MFSYLMSNYSKTSSNSIMYALFMIVKWSEGKREREALSRVVSRSGW